MDIHGVPGVGGPRRIEPKKGAKVDSYGKPAGDEKTDSVEISQKARDLAIFLDKLAKLPAVRMDRINTIRAQIEKGEYETAEKLEIAVSRLLEEITAPG